MRRLALMVLAIIMLVFSSVPMSAVTTETRVSTDTTILVAPACNITGRREGIPHDADFHMGSSTGPPCEVTDVTVTIISQKNNYTELGQDATHPDSILHTSCNCNPAYCSVPEKFPSPSKAPPH